MQVLLSDMGGTNIRFAVMDERHTSDVVRFKCADFSSFEEVLAHFLSTSKVKPSHFVLGVPGQILGDELFFCHNSWRFKISDIKKRFGFENFEVMNDFQAQTLAILNLQKKQVLPIGAGKADKKFPSLIVGAGTGLGVGVLLPDGRILSSEGGHISLSPTNETEEKILQAILKKFGHTSAERAVSGPGLCFLYEFFTGNTLSSEQILQNALKNDKKALQAVLQMFAFWGAVCADLTLAFCARGGVYLSGGIIQAEGAVELLRNSDFRKRFEEKGPDKVFMEPIPTSAVIQKEVAFLGLEVAGKKYFK